MKLSNNAIKFLMAQYRAIYKNAYFKGIASAVVLTAGLAAGAAQAADQGDITVTTQIDSGDTATSVSAATDIQLKGKDATGGASSLSVTGSVTVSSGKTLTIGNTDGGTDFGLDVTVNGASSLEGTLTLRAGGGTASNDGSNDVNVTFNEALTAASGINVLGGSSGAATLTVVDGKVLTLGGDTKVTAGADSGASLVSNNIVLQKNATVKLSGGTSAKATLGKDGAEYTLGEGSTITVGSSGALTGSKLTSTGGKIAFSENSDFTLINYGESEKNPAAQKLNLDVASTKALTTKLKSGSERGVLHFASGSQINLNNDGVLSVSGASNIGSVVIFDEGVQITKGKIEVSGAGTGGGSSGSLLKTDAAVAKSFLDAGGQLNLKANSTLEVDGDIGFGAGATGNSYKIASGSGKDGEINLAAESTIKAQNITATEKFADNLNNKLNITAANNLTLGSSSSTGGDFKFNKATAKNLILNSSSSFNLGNNVTLNSVDENGEADTGTISGSLTLGTDSKGLTITSGIYEHKDGLTLGSGTLTVNGAGNTATLKVAGDVTLDQTGTNGAITVSGAKSTLDLSEANLAYGTGTDKSTTFTVSGGSTLKIGGESLSGLLKRANDASGAQFNLSGTSTLEVVGSLELNKAHLVTSAALTGKQTGISLSGDSAQFKVTDTLTVKSGTELSLGAKGKAITAGNLAFTDAGDAFTVLKSGTYTAINGLTTDAATGFNISGGAAVVNLGVLEDVLTEDGKVNYTNGLGGGDLSAVTLSGGSLAVNAGSWNAGEGITITEGTLTVGQADTGAKVDDNGVAINASLNATGNIETAAASGLEVTKHGALTAAGLKAATSSVTVAGSLNINTKYDKTGGDAYKKTGLELADDAVTIAAGGTVTLGGEGALTALGISGRKTVKAADISGTTTNADVSGAFASTGSFKDNLGSTLKLDLGGDADKVTFELAALGALQERLYGTGTEIKGTIDIGGAAISGIKPENGEIKWNTITTAKAQNVMPNYESDDLKGAVLVAQSSSDVVAGHYGSIRVEDNTASEVKVNNKVSLNLADANGNLVANKAGETIGLSTSQDGTYVKLNAAGKVGAVKLSKDSTLDIGAKDGAVSLMSVNGTTASLINNGNVDVAGDVNIGKLNTAEGSSLTIKKGLTVNEKVQKTVVNGNLTVAAAAKFMGKTDIQGNATVGSFDVAGALTSTDGSMLKVTSGAFTAKDIVEAKGSIQVDSGDASFTKGAQLHGADNQFKKVTFATDVEFGVGKTTAAEINLTSADNNDLAVISGGTLTSEVITANSKTTIHAGTLGDKDKKIAPSNGYISAGRLDLNGGTLVADPEYGSAATVVAVKQLGDGTAADTTNFAAGTLNGKVYALQNSVVSLGSDSLSNIQNTFAQYFDANGSLNKDEVGAIAFISDEIKVSNGSVIVVDSTANDNRNNAASFYENKAATTGAYNGADLYIGENSVLAVSAEATDKRAAVTFDKSGPGVTGVQNAYIKVADKNSSKVVIASEGINAMTDVKLFANTTAAGGDSGIKFAPNSATELRVETMNGLFYTTLDEKSLGSEFSLKLDAHKADKAFANISQPVRDTILTVAYGAHNPAAFEVSADGAEPQDPQELVGELHSQFVKVADGADTANSFDGIALRGADGNADTTKTTEQVKTALVNAGLLDAKTGESFYSVDFYGNVYRDAESKFLAHVLSSLNGVDAETAARLADFGGVAQAALRAGNTTSDAIAARMGVGVNGTVTFAANGQGSGMWVTPVYKTADSDSFGADGVDYGTDMNLYGVAVGADVSVMENVSAGVMFNVGSGDADGQGLGSNVKNDFDYYGFGAYMGYTMGAASVVADVSWTTVDNSVEGQTGLGTLAASIDSSALSLGVTGKYAMDFGGVNVTPHAGLRFTRIDQDDYTVGNGTDVFAQYSSNSMNVFSVPVGVTVEKEYTFDAWSVKPAFDLTLTGNFGDDETSGTVDWEGISNLSTDIKSEFVDTFTYSTAIGVAAQTGNFGMGLGVNYTGASNVKEFGVNANVRYVF